MTLLGWGKPHGRIVRLLGRFGNNQNGATAVEFAMVSVPFLGLLFAIFETAFVFFVTEALESAVADAGRTIMTGNASTYTSADAFRTGVICPTTGKKLIPSFITCGNLMIDVRTVGTSGSIGFGSATSGNTSKSFYTDPSTMKFCIGSTGDTVIMRMVYPMPVYLSVLTASNVGDVFKSTTGQTTYTSADGSAGLKHMLMGTAAFRNEPFSAQTIQPGC